MILVYLYSNNVIDIIASMNLIIVSIGCEIQSKLTTKWFRVNADMFKEECDYC